MLTGESGRSLVVHHRMGQLALVRRGRGYASLDGETISIEGGDLIIMAAGCKHSFMCPHDELELRHWHWPQALLHTDRTILVGTFDFSDAASRGTATLLAMTSHRPQAAETSPRIMLIDANYEDGTVGGRKRSSATSLAG